MSKHYPKLLQQEKIRLRAYTGVVLVLLFTPFILLLIFAKTWTYFAGAIALGIILATIGAKLVRRYVRVTCPLCDSKNVRENYYGGRGSEDVAHTCDSCGASYDNGILQEDPEPDPAGV